MNEIEELVAKARQKLSPAELARLQEQWRADEEKAAEAAKVKAAAELEAAREKVRTAIAALRAIDADAINQVQAMLRGSA